MTDAVISTDPRVAHTRAVVLDATVAILAERGFERLTVEAVAERSGVARSTIYRNWPDRSVMLSDAYELMCSKADIPDLGSMRAELELLANELAQSLNTAEWAHALPSLVGAARHDEGLTDAQRLISERRLSAIALIFERAAERGETIADGDPRRLAEFFASGFFFRFLMTRAPIDELFRQVQIDAVITLASRSS